MRAKKNFLLVKNQRIEQNERLSEKAKARLGKSKADNTLKAYCADWSDFSDWCRYHGERDLPARPETIVNYLNDLADDAKANTVARTIRQRTRSCGRRWRRSGARRARSSRARRRS